MLARSKRRSALLLLAVGVVAALAAGLAGSAPGSLPGLNGKIAFVSSRDGGLDIFSMNPDGSGQTHLTHTPNFREVQPSWSPDGTRIAYASAPPAHIYVMNADGSGQTQLTFDPSTSDRSPAWTADGSK